MALTLNLQKSSSTLKLSLQKSGIHSMPVLDMAMVLDVSGSFEDEHLDGTTTDLLTRLAPWGLTFDPDKKIDILTFSNGAASAHLVGAFLCNFKAIIDSSVVLKPAVHACHHADHPALTHIAAPHIDGLHGAVLGLQTNHIAFGEPTLHRRLATQQYHSNFARLRRVAPAYEQVIARQDARVDHRLAHYPQRKNLARSAAQ